MKFRQCSGHSFPYEFRYFIEDESLTVLEALPLSVKYLQTVRF